MNRALVLVVVACSHPPAPVAPSTTVRDEIALAEDAERARRHDLAREHYEKAVAGARDPRSVDLARAKFGETLATWGEYAEAMAQLEQAVAAVPDDAEAWHNLGILREHEGNPTGAIAALERARDLLPQDIRPRIALAAARWKHGDLTGAAAEYHELLRLDLPERLRKKVLWALDQLAKQPK